MVLTDGQVKSSSNNQPQAPVQTLQPVVAAPSGAMGTLMRYQFHWSHAIFAVGLLAVSGAGTAVLVKVATFYPLLFYHAMSQKCEHVNSYSLLC